MGPPAPSDAELISATRTGDADAYGKLTARHAHSARRLARMLVPTDDVEALVADAFAKIELVLRRGDGPSLALRPYLLTAVRRLAADHGESAPQPVAGPQDAAAARAFTSLAEPWRLALWHTDVEGEDPADIAVLLGEPVDDVAPLIARAREGMRSAWLAMQEPATDKECAWTRRALGAYARQVSFHDDTARVEQHLEGCADCTAILRELTESGSDLRTILAPLVLGAAAATYLDTTKGGNSPSSRPSGLAAARAAAVGAITAAFGRAGSRVGSSAASAAGRIGEQFAKVKVLTAKRTAAVAIAGVAAVAVIAGGTFIVVQTSDGPVEASADAPGDIALDEDATVDEPPATDDPADPEASDIGAPASASRSASASDNPSSSASSLSTDDPTFGPSDTPSENPTRPGQSTQQPSQNPTGPGQPTQQPTRQPTRQPTQTTQPPTQTPTSTPTPAPPPTDLSISASSNNLAGTFYAIDVRITGLGSGATATLTVQSSGGNGSGLTMDGNRCTQTAGGGATCRVTSDPESFRFRANALSGRSNTLTFTVTPDNGSDANPSDNSTSVTIRP